MTAPTAPPTAERSAADAALQAKVRDAKLARAHVELGQEVQRIARKYELSLGEVIAAVAFQGQGLASLLVECERRPPRAEKKEEPLLVLPSSVAR